MSKSIYFSKAERLFKNIQNQYPELNMEIDYEDPNVDLSMSILKQQGLDFDIYLNLQNSDELHISTKFIWCQFFPAASDELVQDFMLAVIGLINGSYRVLQFVKHKKIHKAYLQKPIDEGWETIYKHFKKTSFPWTKFEFNIIQNGKGSDIIDIY